MLRRAAAVVVPVAGLLACGSRSDLSRPLGTGAAPSYGIVSSGSGAGGSDGGAGGGSVVCNRLQARVEARGFDTMPGHFARAPQLAYTNRAQTQATLVVRTQPEPLPIAATPLLTQVTFEPWTSWDGSSLGIERLLGPGLSFRIPRTAEDGLTVWYAHNSQLDGPKMSLIVSASTDEDSPPAFDLLPFVAAPAYVTGPSGGEVGFGYSLQVGGNSFEMIAGSYDGQQQQGWAGFGCSWSPVPAAGIAAGGKLLAASASAFECAGFHQLTWGVYTSTEPPALLARDAAPLVLQVEMVPRSDGAWLVWQSGDGGGYYGPVMAMRIAADGSARSDAMPVVGQDTVLQPFGVGQLGDRLAIAYRDTLSLSLLIQVFDDDGGVTQQAAYVPERWPRDNEPLSVLGAPNGGALLLAWSSEPLDTTVPQQTVHVARFDCAP